jgi:hypothetical protein
VRRLEEVFLKQRVLPVFLPLVRHGTSDRGAYTVEEDVLLKQSGHNAMGSDPTSRSERAIIRVIISFTSPRLAALRV